MFKSKKVKVVSQVENPMEQLKMMMAPPENAEREKNHIYFYTDVSQETCLDLSRKLNDLGKELLKLSIDYDIPPPKIHLHINTLGGDLLSAFGVVDVIKNSRVPVVSIIEGQNASAGTIISMACHERYITENSFMLIHQLSTGIYGKYDEIKDDFENDTKFMERLYKLYRENTKMNDKKIKEVLSRDKWWTADECIANGLVDGLWGSSEPKTKKQKR